jgi:hypothetical protein
MRLSAPTVVVFLISLVLAVIALLAYLTGVFNSVAFIKTNMFWIMTAAYIVLAVGALLPGL